MGGKITTGGGNHNYSLSLPVELHEMIRQEAEERGRSVSAVMREAYLEHAQRAGRLVVPDSTRPYTMG